VITAAFDHRPMKLEQFARQCHDILGSDPGPAGRRKVCALLQEALRDREFVSSSINLETPERHVLYEDPELGFCILAHNYTGPKDSPPHDHGPSWAIYGQASGETHMIDYERVAEPADGKPGKAKAVRTYKLAPGAAHLYNERDLHSPRRDGPTQLIRIEGTNMDRVKRERFDKV
jgi:predicted metal-dependent enzyme (double-stranded beta helix superfamily)